MNRMREWWKRAAGLFHKERRDAELTEELASHLEMLVEQNVERGMTPEEARRAARIALGGGEQIKEAVREQRGLPFVESLIADTRFGLRALGKNPGFTCVGTLTLALGIGANAAIFSVVNGILLETLPYAGSSRLVRIANEYKVRGMPMGLQGASLPEIADVQAQSTVFERLAIYQENFGGTIRTDLMPDTSGISQVSADFFPMMGVKPLATSRGTVRREARDPRHMISLLLCRCHLWTEKPMRLTGLSGGSMSWRMASNSAAMSSS